MQEQSATICRSDLAPEAGSEIKQLFCKNCGHDVDYKIVIKGHNNSAYCKTCSGWIKNLSFKKYKTDEKLAILWDRTNGRCAYCGTTINPYRKSQFDIDHYIARYHGGNNNTENLVMSCIRCNRSKGSKSIDEYKQYLESKFNRKVTFYFEKIRLIINNQFSRQ